MPVALTRDVPRNLADCELTHVERVAIDVAVATEQHALYEAALEAAGCRIERLPRLDEHADSVFVEDTAVVFDEVAVVTRPGAESRRGETASVARALERYRTLRVIDEPGTMDGGDVLRAGRHVFVGLSSRTNTAAARQLEGILAPFGYNVHRVELSGCLHLKSAATAVDDDLLLVNPDWVDVRQLGGLRLLDVHPEEPHAANVLRIGDVVLCAAAFPFTQAALETNGFSVWSVDMSEFAKAEGALTCCSVIVP